MKDCEFYIGPMEWFPPGKLSSLPQEFANKERNVYINMGNMGIEKGIIQYPGQIEKYRLQIDGAVSIIFQS
jgi:hypothetical protein